MTIDTKHLYLLLNDAAELPWTLATSNSWRRIVDFRHDNVCQPITQPMDGHPDLLFAGGVEGPNAKLMVDGINALPGLLDEIEDLRAREAAKDVIVRSVAAALERHGITEADDPGEAIDVLVADKDAEIKRLREVLARVARSFPTDTDMIAAGWEPLEIEEACKAYDAARAVLQEPK